MHVYVKRANFPYRLKGTLKGTKGTIMMFTPQPEKLPILPKLVLFSKIRELFGANWLISEKIKGTKGTLKGIKGTAQ
jgi:hypothetical protein